MEFLSEILGEGWWVWVLRATRIIFLVGFAYEAYRIHKALDQKVFSKALRRLAIAGGIFAVIFTLAYWLDFYVFDWTKGLFSLLSNNALFLIAMIATRRRRKKFESPAYDEESRAKVSEGLQELSRDFRREMRKAGVLVK